MLVLGVMLSGVLIARGRLSTQWGEARVKLTAVEAADELLHNWFAAEKFPVGQTGKTGDWHWRVLRLKSPEAAMLKSYLLRLELWSLADMETPALEVDFLAPIPREEPEEDVTDPTSQTPEDLAKSASERGAAPRGEGQPQ